MRVTSPLIPYAIAAVSVACAAYLGVDRAALNAELAQSRADLLKVQAALDNARNSQTDGLNPTLSASGTLAVSSDSSEVAAATSTRESGVPVAESESAATEAKPQEGPMNFSKMLKDPENRKMMRNAHMMGLRMMYADLTIELGLKGSEADDLMELLTDHTLEMAEIGMKLMAGGGKTDSGDSAQQMEAMEKKRADALKKKLGEEKFARFEAYENTIAERMFLNSSEATFRSSGAPLTENQRRDLLEIMIAERKNHPSPFGGNPRSTLSKQQDLLTSKESIDSLMQNEEKYHQQVVNRAHTALTPDQVLVLDRTLRNQREMTSMSIQMSRKMMGADAKP